MEHNGASGPYGGCDLLCDDGLSNAFPDLICVEPGATTICRVGAGPFSDSGPVRLIILWRGAVIAYSVLKLAELRSNSCRAMGAPRYHKF